jgi:hypothetical protein
VTETPQEGKDRLQALVDSHTNGARKRSRRIVYGGLVAIGVAATLVAGLILQRLDVTFSNDESNAAVARAIQAERARATRVSCEVQNVRHGQIVVALDGFLAERSATPAERAEARQFTTALAEAIAPKRDCDKVVARSVRQGRGP